MKFLKIIKQSAEGPGRRSPVFFTVLFTGLFILLLLSGLSEYRLRRHSVLTLMGHMSHSLANAVNKAMENSILQYDRILEEAESRMAGALWTLDRIEDMRPLDNAVLGDLADYNFLRYIEVYGPDRNLLYSSLGRETGESAAPYLLPLFSSGKDYLLPGFRPDPDGSGRGYVLAALRKRGGIFTAAVDGDELTRIQKELGVASLLNSIIEDESIRYIAIQDSLGILAASKNVSDLSSISGDEFLSDIQITEQFAYRTAEFQGETIYESAMPFRVHDTRYGIIRIGLDSRSLDDINRSALRNALLRFGALLVLSFLFISYSVLRQNNRLLITEKDRMSSEVYELQEDLRRREKVGAMWDLAAGVAHEIRNPLNAMSLSAQRLAKRLKDSDMGSELEMITRIRSEIQRLDTIIRQFLQFSRPKPLNLTQVDMAELTSEIAEFYRALFDSRGIELRRDIRTVSFVNGDRDKLKQVFVNLIENSLHATADGGKVSISVGEKNDFCHIAIEDNGKGIPEEDLPKIFNLYFSTREDGSGLGLAQVYQIVTEHRGHIDISSRPGEGTRVIVRLPLRKGSK